MCVGTAKCWSRRRRRSLAKRRRSASGRRRAPRSTAGAAKAARRAKIFDAQSWLVLKTRGGIKIMLQIAPKSAIKFKSLPKTATKNVNCCTSIKQWRLGASLGYHRHMPVRSAWSLKSNTKLFGAQHKHVAVWHHLSPTLRCPTVSKVMRQSDVQSPVIRALRTAQIRSRSDE